jgi:hypothetical protein
MMRPALSVFVVSLMLLASCGKKEKEVSPERAASNADFQDWVGKLPEKLKPPKPDRKSRAQGIFQGCLMATTVDMVVTCRCNVRAITKTYKEPELGVALDRAWIEIAKPWRLATPEDIATIEARVAGKPVDPVKVKAVQDIQALCGSPESLKDE